MSIKTNILKKQYIKLFLVYERSNTSEKSVKNCNMLILLEYKNSGRSLRFLIYHISLCQQRFSKTKISFILS